MTQIATLQDAESYAAQHGIALSPSDRARIAAAQRAERERLEAVAPAEKRVGLVESFNAAYPKFLEALSGIGDVLLTTAQTLIVAFGVPLVLVLLLIVEHQRIFHGIELFETDAGLASFAAAALVIVNLVLEFTIHYVEQRAGYSAERATRWSFRTWLINAAHTLGVGDEWEERQLSPAHRYRRLLNLVTFSILALALAGSMRTVISTQAGAWHVALIDIVTKSTLTQMATWLGGLLFAGAAVLSAQGLSRYVALRCAEIVAGMTSRRDSTAPDVAYQSQIDSAGAQVVMALVSAKLEAKAAKVRPTAGDGQPPRPFGIAALDLDDEGDTQPTDPLHQPNVLPRIGRENVTK